MSLDEFHPLEILSFASASEPRFWSPIKEVASYDHSMMYLLCTSPPRLVGGEFGYLEQLNCFNPLSLLFFSFPSQSDINKTFTFFCPF